MISDVGWADSMTPFMEDHRTYRPSVFVTADGKCVYDSPATHVSKHAAYWVGQAVGMIDTQYVEPEYRRRLLGRRMENAVKTKLVALGCTLAMFRKKLRPGEIRSHLEREGFIPIEAVFGVVLTPKQGRAA